MDRFSRPSRKKVFTDSDTQDEQDDRNTIPSMQQQASSHEVQEKHSSSQRFPTKPKPKPSDVHVPPLAQQHVQAVQNWSGRPIRDEEEKETLYTELVRLRQNRYTNRECAEKMGLSLRTIMNYQQDPFYTEVEQNLILEQKQRGHLLIADAIPGAVQKLWELGHSATSEFVQFKAMETLLKYAGYETPPDIRQKEGNSEVLEFLAKLEQRGISPSSSKKTQVQVNVQITNTSSPSTSSTSSLTQEGMIIDAVPVAQQQAQEEGQHEESYYGVADPVLAYQIPLLPGGRLPPLPENAK